MIALSYIAIISHVTTMHNSRCGGEPTQAPPRAGSRRRDVRPSGKLVPVHIDLVEHRLRVHLGEVGAPKLTSLLLCDHAVAVYSR